MSPFKGKRVALVHPAWHSCGTYQVVIGQLAAWRALGAEVTTIAVSDQPGFAPAREWIWKSYRQATPELDAAPRAFAGPPLHRLASPQFFARTLWPYLHGDQAAIRAGMAARADLARDVRFGDYDLVHCNHFFCMPVALQLSRAHRLPPPIMMETHDIQARQFRVQIENRPWLKPHATYEAMLAQELFWMSKADLLIHLNDEEDSFFRNALPDKRHALLYPAVPEAPTGPGGEDVILVASRNRANVESVIWFLREAAPKIEVPFKIVGSVDAGVKANAPALYEAYKHTMAGRVDDLGAVYARARLALLPTIEGTGLSIKSVEAMASGLPLVATPQAFRGMNFDVSRLRNVALQTGAADFAAAVERLCAGPAPSAQERAESDTRRAFEAHFSESAYARNLSALAAPLLQAGAA
jgi:glycosyltransferase involved in cell wall biosynthesis